MPSLPPRATWLPLVEAALAEDLGPGDATSQALLSPEERGAAVLEARAELVVCGLDVAREVFALRGVTCELVARDGDAASAGAPLAHVRGSAIGILEAERTALNFVQRLSGIATHTRRFRLAVRGTSAEIVDTRKTTPGWRRFEKYAVTCGGGENHRLGLFDMVLIKDNHLAALKNASPNAIAAAVTRARTEYRTLKVEVEADTLDQVEQAVAAGADFVLLDNMNLNQLRLAVEKCRGHAKTEASGGVNLATVRPIAETGVDFISVGALTHSARAVDIGLDFQD